MILMTPEEAAEEFGVSRRQVHYWAARGDIAKHPRQDNGRPQGGGSQGFYVERAQMVARVKRMAPRDRRGGRRSRSRATPQHPPAPDPT